MSTKMGFLTPILCTEVIPGDVIKGNTEVLVRVAPLLAPVYEKLSLYVHIFFVPNRLLWEEWETFITGGRLGAEAAPDEAPIPPYFKISDLVSGAPTTSGKGTLADYLGCPVFTDIDPVAANWDVAGATVDAMPFAAYQQIYMDYYRDRNFVPDDQIELPLTSGEQNPTTGQITTRWERNYLHDYFTSALPFMQRGAEVLMPIQLGGVASLYADPVDNDSTSSVLTAIEQPGSANVGYGVLLDATPPSLPAGSSTWVNGSDFTNTSSTIADFRAAYALQVWLERNAIGGSRYTESVQAHFAVRPQDQRLQRAEYLGGGRMPIQISEIVSTAYSDDGEATVPLANLAGHGVAYGNTNYFSYFCPEHGFVMAIMSIMAPPSYHQGLPRMFRRKTFLDYPWPTFATLGEQTVEKRELYCSPATMTEDADGELPMFGYQSRYADWKYIPSSNRGDFHDTLLFWTLCREFSSVPELGYNFNIWPGEEARLFAVQDGTDQFWCLVFNKVGVKRSLPYFGKPNTLGFGS